MTKKKKTMAERILEQMELQNQRLEDIKSLLVTQNKILKLHARSNVTALGVISKSFKISFSNEGYQINEKWVDEMKDMIDKI